MIIDKGLVKKIADLSKLEVRDKDIQKISLQLSKILEHMKGLDKVKVADVVPMFHGCVEDHELRADVASHFNSDIIVKDHFSVPNIISGE